MSEELSIFKNYSKEKNNEDNKITKQDNCCSDLGECILNHFYSPDFYNFTSSLLWGGGRQLVILEIVLSFWNTWVNDKLIKNVDRFSSAYKLKRVHVCMSVYLSMSVFALFSLTYFPLLYLRLFCNAIYRHRFLIIVSRV